VAKSKLEERRKKTVAEHDAMIGEIEASIEAAKNHKPINPVWLSKCIGDVMDDKTIIVNETVTSRLAEVIHLNRPGSHSARHWPPSRLGIGRGHRNEVGGARRDGYCRRRRRVLYVLRADRLSLHGAEISHSISYRDL